MPSHRYRDVHPRVAVPLTAAERTWPERRLAAAPLWVPVDLRDEPVPKAAEGRLGWQRGASNRRAREELGWVPAYPSWRDGPTAEAG